MALPKICVIAPQRPQRLGMDHDAGKLAHWGEEAIASHSADGFAKQHIRAVQDMRLACRGLPGDDVDPAFIIRLGNTDGREEYSRVVAGTAACPQ